MQLIYPGNKTVEHVRNLVYFSTMFFFLCIAFFIYALSSIQWSAKVSVWMLGWLASWLVGWLATWLAGWLAGWLAT